MRSFPPSSTTAPPSGQRKTACRGGVSRAGAHTRTKASSFLRPARARTRASTASALTATTGPLRRIRAIRASRGASTSIRTTSAGTTTTAASGGPSVPSGTPTSARPARGRGRRTRRSASLPDCVWSRSVATASTCGACRLSDSSLVIAPSSVYLHHWHCPWCRYLI